MLKAITIEIRFMALICLTLTSFIIHNQTANPAVISNNLQIKTVEAGMPTLYETLEASMEPTVPGKWSYAQKCAYIRSAIDSTFEEGFVKNEVLIPFGPKIILGCMERGLHTPGERVAQLLLESSKVVNDERTWSNLTKIHNNFGGIKAKRGRPATPPLATQEVYNGHRAIYKLAFAKFNNKWEGIDAYLDVVSLNRYRTAQKYRGREHFLKLAKAHYCTEPAESYARLCMAFYEQNDLEKLNNLLKKCEQKFSSASPSLLLAEARQ